jgi:hypothetical protein
VFSGHPLAVAVGLGVAGCIGGVDAGRVPGLGRLLHTVTARPTRSIIGVLSVVLVASGPLSLIDPELFYNDLLKPS